MFVDPPARQRFWHRHPWLSAVAVLLALWLVQSGVYLPLLLIATIAIVVGTRRRRRARERQLAGLRARADLEHRMVLAGDPRGVHGRYPPVYFGSVRQSAHSFGQ